MIIDKIKRLKELAEKRDELREKLQAELRMVTIKIGEFTWDRWEKMELRPCYEMGYKSIVIRRGSGGGLELGELSPRGLLESIIQYTEHREYYEKRIEMLKLIDAQLYEEAKNALKQLELVIELVRTLGDPIEIALFILGEKHK